MKVEEIRKIAGIKGIKVGKMNKTELVQAIQVAEENVPCFDTGAVSVCGQRACFWREDCA